MLFSYTFPPHITFFTIFAVAPICNEIEIFSAIPHFQWRCVFDASKIAKFLADFRRTAAYLVRAVVLNPKFIAEKLTESVVGVNSGRGKVDWDNIFQPNFAVGDGVAFCADVVPKWCVFGCAEHFAIQRIRRFP